MHTCPSVSGAWRGRSFEDTAWPRMRILFAAVFCLLLFLTAGCSRAPDDTSRTERGVTGDLRMPIQVQVSNFVRRQPPAIYVRPREPLGYRPTALFVPLRTVQQMSNAVTFSNMFSRQIWQVWLSLNAFSALEYDTSAAPFEPQRALAIARARGAQMLVSGYINHYMDGGSGGTSSLSLAMEVYDVKTGTVVWSMAQGGLMDARQVHDFYLFSITEVNPEDPSSLIARTLAWDMGRQVLGWVDPSHPAPRDSSWTDMFKSKAF